MLDKVIFSYLGLEFPLRKEQNCLFEINVRVFHWKAAPDYFGYTKHSRTSEEQTQICLKLSFWLVLKVYEMSELKKRT
jgi:hypothetical protein